MQAMFTHLHRSGMHWTIKPGFEKALPDDLPANADDCARDSRATLIRDNNVRMSFLYRSGDAGLFIKRYKCRSLWDTVKYFFFPSKAIAEWRNLRRFEEQGIPTSAPLAVAEKRMLRLLRESCLVTASLAPAEALNEYLLKARLAPLQRQQLACALARLVKKLHDANVFFRDLHAGNILIDWSRGGQPALFLIDLHKAWFVARLQDWMRVRDLGQLCNSLAASRTDGIRFLKTYLAGQPDAAYRSLQHKIQGKQIKLEAVRIKSRSKRCIRHSTVFEKKRTWAESYFGRKDFGKKPADAAISLHCTELASGTARILKRASKSAVTLHALEGHGQVCVKGYRHVSLWYSLKNIFKKSRALKSWIAAHGLLVRGIDTPLPLAVLERTCGPLRRESFLITGLLPDARELNDYIRAADPGERKADFIASLAAMLRRVHDRGVYHADLKSNNILVQEAGPGWRFSLIDLDRTYFTDGLSFLQRSNNLAQINASVAACMTLRDRLKFFHFYAKGTVFYGQRREYYRRILAISRRKNTAPYGVLFT
jgi:tRNA A-37 threonylcarbamoyl transferase component Bud32